MDWHCKVINPQSSYFDYYSLNQISLSGVKQDGLAPSVGFIANFQEAESLCQSLSGTAVVVQDGPETLAAILQRLIEIPPQIDIQELWMTGFALPLICYLTAWGYQTLIAWFEQKGEH